MSDWTSILVEKLQYKNSILYVHCMTFYKKEENSEYYNLDVYYRKILKFKNIKKFEYYTDEYYYNFPYELGELKKELGIEYFTKIFYRSKDKNKIYIYDKMSHFTVIEFDNTKKWNYRKQIK